MQAAYCNKTNINSFSFLVLHWQTQHCIWPMYLLTDSNKIMTPKKSITPKKPAVAKAPVAKDTVKKIERAAFIIRAVQNADRQRILRHILTNNESVVSQLCSKLKVEQSIMSQHLAILRTANLVSTRREGKYIYYTVSAKNWNKVIELVTRLGEL